ncbi:MAG: glycosyltransferase, partial [Phycisphaerae bacterium]|nr:glycosyltransferase [Phycisphaerae bacterium]
PPAMPTRLSIAPNAPIHQNSIHYGMIVKNLLCFSGTQCRMFLCVCRNFRSHPIAARKKCHSRRRKVCNRTKPAVRRILRDVQAPSYAKRGMGNHLHSCRGKKKHSRGISFFALCFYPVRFIKYLPADVWAYVEDSISSREISRAGRCVLVRRCVMRVFMLGWEFPPYISGGLGTACYGLTRGLDEIGVQVCFVLPTAVPISGEGGGVELRTPSDAPEIPSGRPTPQDVLRELPKYEFENVEIHRLEAKLQAYASAGDVQEELRRLKMQVRSQAAKDLLRRALAEKNGKTYESAVPVEPAVQAALPTGSLVMGGAGVHYDGNLLEQVYRYADLAVRLARKEPFDVIHAHDWMTYPAAIAAANLSGKPLVVHVHSTEFDRAGEHPNQQVYDIERAGMARAHRVVCVSHLTANIIQHRYGVPRGKIDVVYNAVELPNGNGLQMRPIERGEKIVLFLGRVTMQKGPEYFLQAAKKVVEKFDKVRFVLAGSGDMIRQCIQLAADLRLGRHVTFTGFLRGPDVERIFQMADLYVMPSVSEPFGIAPLEALSHNVPVIISKQSGVSEILTHVLKVDFWDTDEMANKILAVLRHEPLQRTLRQQARFELGKVSWRDSAQKLKDIYTRLTAEA